MTNYLGIDVETKGKNEIIRRLKALKGTGLIVDHGAYHEDETYSKISVATDKTEAQMDQWLWENNLAYVGVFKVEKFDE